MHVRVTYVQIRPDKVDEATQLYQESVVPAAKQQQGFKGMTLVTDRASGKGISLSYWETEADMAAGEASGYYQQQLAKFGPMLVAPPTREAYEVAVQA
jgi:heme-degrading monooxygenase HmoA